MLDEELKGNQLITMADDGSQKSIETRRSTKDLIKDFCSYTTTHGIGRLAEAKSIFVRIMWTLFVIGAFTGFFVQTHELFALYRSRPVSTAVIVRSETRASFPAVTICNLNMIKKSKLSGDYIRALNHELTKKYSEWRHKQSNEEATSNDTRRCFACKPEYAHIVEEVIRNKLAVENFTELAEMGHRYEDLVFGCSFRGRDCSNFSNHWSYFWNHRYGNCFTFNGGTDGDGNNQTVLVTRSTGPSGGLKLELYMEKHEYLSYLSHSAGARILVHSQGDMPFPDDEGHDLFPGCSTSVGIRREILERVDRFFNGSCIQNNDDKRDTLYSKKLGASYSKEACLKTCLAEAQIDTCGCAESRFPVDQNLLCHYVMDDPTDTCLEELARKFDERGLDCEKECPFPCSEVTYKLSMSMADWPADEYKSVLCIFYTGLTVNDEDFLKRVSERGITSIEEKSEKDSSVLDKNFLQVRVFFERLNIEEVREEHSYRGIRLVADIGGQLGLWIGISVLTCCEVLELVMLILQNMFKKAATTNNQEKKDAILI